MERKCENCGIILLDPMPSCPLCHRKVTLEKDGGVDRIEPAYPLAKKKTRRGENALRIYFFSALAAFFFLFALNKYLEHEMWWTVMIGLFMIYGFVTLFFSLRKRIGHQPKMMLQSLLAVLLVLFIDYATGFHGWSLNYVFPGLLAFIDLLIVILMLVNKWNWQSYIIMQLWVVILSVTPFILYLFGLVDHLQVSWLILISVILVFAATLVIGGSRARSEMARRFHR